MKKSNLKLNSWQDLINVSKKLNTEIVQYLVPMGFHGLKATRIVLDANDEIMQELKHYDTHKHSTAGSIVLIGTEY